MTVRDRAQRMVNAFGDEAPDKALISAAAWEDGGLVAQVPLATRLETAYEYLALGLACEAILRGSRSHTH